ncbi:hypothetical protein [Endozoicomonas sp. OPT23]|uniref:hypothetical protein n=1 Tax=Endozoicomonas sp. OPT23 TaxID=2072845 RepID=UPI00129AAF94|nr:hypothetical protein [Endozoicomonas sp. OPT23]
MKPKGEHWSCQNGDCKKYDIVVNLQGSAINSDSVSDLGIPDLRLADPDSDEGGEVKSKYESNTEREEDEIAAATPPSDSSEITLNDCLLLVPVTHRLSILTNFFGITGSEAVQSFIVSLSEQLDIAPEEAARIIRQISRINTIYTTIAQQINVQTAAQSQNALVHMTNLSTTLKQEDSHASVGQSWDNFITEHGAEVQIQRRLGRSDTSHEELYALAGSALGEGQTLTLAAQLQTGGISLLVAEPVFSDSSEFSVDLHSPNSGSFSMTVNQLTDFLREFVVQINVSSFAVLVQSPQSQQGGATPM